MISNVSSLANRFKVYSMRLYRVAQSSVTFQFAFSKILPFLPIPPTLEFKSLRDVLTPYGLSSNSVTVVSAISNLSEASVTIALLSNTVTLRLLYERVDLFVSRQFTGDVNLLSEIVQKVFGVLKELDSSSESGTAQINILAHCDVAPGEADAFIQEQLHGPPILTPDAFAYKMNMAGAGIRIVFAKSAILPEGIFTDYSITYPAGTWQPDLGARTLDSFNSTLAILGLMNADTPLGATDELA